MAREHQGRVGRRVGAAVHRCHPGRPLKTWSHTRTQVHTHAHRTLRTPPPQLPAHGNCPVAGSRPHSGAKYPTTSQGSAACGCFISRGRGHVAPPGTGPAALGAVGCTGHRASPTPTPAFGRAAVPVARGDGATGEALGPPRGGPLLPSSAPPNLSPCARAGRAAKPAVFGERLLCTVAPAPDHQKPQPCGPSVPLEADRVQHLS